MVHGVTVANPPPAPGRGSGGRGGTGSPWRCPRWAAWCTMLWGLGVCCAITGFGVLRFATGKWSSKPTLIFVSFVAPEANLRGHHQGWPVPKIPDRHLRGGVTGVRLDSYVFVYLCICVFVYLCICVFVQDFCEELEYWGLDDLHMEPCCQHTYYRARWLLPTPKIDVILQLPCATFHLSHVTCHWLPFQCYLFLPFPHTLLKRKRTF